MADKLPFFAAETGTYSTTGPAVSLSGTAVSLGTYPARTFAAAAADTTLVFDSTHTCAVVIVKDATNFKRYTGAVWTDATPDTISLATATLEGSAGTISNNDAVSVYASQSSLAEYALLIGRAGGQSLSGGTAASETLTLSSTAHATKGKVLIGTSAYDEVNNQLGIGTVTPAYRFDVVGNATTDQPTLGSEFLTGGTWTSTGWTGDNTAGWTHTTGNTSPLSYSVAAEVGKFYQITLTRSGAQNGTCAVTIGGATTVGSVAATNGTYSYGPLAATTGVFTVTPESTFDGTLVISVKPVNSISSPLAAFKSSGGTVALEIRASSSASNTLVGNGAGGYIMTGVNNCAHGVGALRSNTTGNYNCAFGVNSLFASPTSDGNTGVGYYSLRYTVGANNVGIGFNALFRNITGSNNVAVGTNAGAYRADGTSNNNTPSDSIFIGADTRALSNVQTNQIVIGTGAIGLGSNTTVIGNDSTTLAAIRGALVLAGFQVPAVHLGSVSTAQSIELSGGITTLTQTAGITITNTLPSGAVDGRIYSREIWVTGAYACAFSATNFNTTYTANGASPTFTPATGEFVPVTIRAWSVSGTTYRQIFVGAPIKSASL